MREVLLCIVVLWLPVALSAQNVLKGKVTDADTGEPVPYANVFFANTTIGTVTDERGVYAIENFPEGKYDLTVSFVGYTTFLRSVDFSNPVQLEINVALKPQSIELSEVMVQADTAGRQYNYQLFKRLFIGQTNNSKECKILNPSDIYVYFDRSDNTLVAYARKPIEIVNEALGYKIYYLLDTFVMDGKTDRLVVLGIPRFEELVATTPAQERRWLRHRDETYYGSLSDFLLSVVNNCAGENGFSVSEFFRVPNRNRPPQELLDKKLAYWREESKRHNGGEVVITDARNDSLSYYLNLNRKPSLVDSLGARITDFAPLFRGTRLTYTGMLHVTYTNEREQASYTQLNGRASSAHQQSIIHLTNPITIYENAYYEAILDVFLEGYLAWSEKISELLPLGYQPANTKKR